MSSIAAVLKDEIVRLARKEVKRELAHLRKQVTAHRSSLAALKKQVAAVERQAKQNARVARSLTKPAEPTASTGRFSAKGLISLRAKLGLSAANFGRLAGVSGQSVYHWESGKTKPQKAQIQSLQALRSLGKREAAARLASLRR